MTEEFTTDAEFSADNGLISGTATYELVDDARDDARYVELVNLQVGGLSLSRYEVVAAVGEAQVAEWEETTLATEHVLDPMGAAADRAYDAWVA